MRKIDHIVLPAAGPSQNRISSSRNCARFCIRCKTFPAAKSGESWVDKQGGFWAQKRVFVCLHGVGVGAAQGRSTCGCLPRLSC